MIRKATIEDYDGLCGVFADLDAFHVAGQPDLFRTPDQPRPPREQVEQVLARDDALFVAEDHRGIVGFAWVLTRQTPPVPLLVPRRLAIVDALGVREGSRGQGLGRALMATAEQWARRNGLVEIEVEVADFDHSAVGFYERLGYATTLRRMRKRLS